tara:strand:- start:9167 stop:9583 length:417 start_codon:yes stop_codon:yes gene_type:complete
LTHISIDRNGKTLHVPEATVQDLMSLLDARYDRERSSLLQDLEDIGANSDEKIEQLKELRATKGLTSLLMRSAFELSGATEIIKHVANPNDVEEVLSAAPDDIVWLALKILGYEASDPSDDAEESSAEGNESSPETST